MLAGHIDRMRELEANGSFHAVLSRIYCSKDPAIKYILKFISLFKLSVELIRSKSVYEIGGQKLGCGRAYSVAQ